MKLAIIGILDVSADMESFLTTERFKEGRKCPHCGYIHISRNGHSTDGKQRYVCKNCGKTFCVTTNSIASGISKNIYVWEKYID